MYTSMKECRFTLLLCSSATTFSFVLFFSFQFLSLSTTFPTVSISWKCETFRIMCSGSRTLPDKRSQSFSFILLNRANDEKHKKTLFASFKSIRNWFPKPLHLFHSHSQLLVFDSSHLSSSCAFTISCPNDCSFFTFTDLADHSSILSSCAVPVNQAFFCVVFFIGTLKSQYRLALCRTWACW